MLFFFQTQKFAGALLLNPTNFVLTIAFWRKFLKIWAVYQEWNADCIIISKNLKVYLFMIR